MEPMEPEVHDEHGNILTKVLIVNDNNETTGCMYVTKEEADQIIEGTISLQTEVDEDGQTVVNLAPQTLGSQEEGTTLELDEDSGQQEDEVEDVTGLDTLSKVIASSESHGGHPGSRTSGGDQTGGSLDHLVMAAHAASSEQTGLGGARQMGSATETTVSGSSARTSLGFESSLKMGDRTPLWRPVVLQADHVSAIIKAAELLCQSQNRQFHPEPYSKKLGSEAAYQEMMALMDFHSDGETPDRLELMRKHAMLFRNSGANSRATTLYEQAVNEAAAQICRHFPALLFHKRDLAILAKQCVKLTGIEFPSSRNTYLPPAPPSQASASAAASSHAPGASGTTGRSRGSGDHGVVFQSGQSSAGRESGRPTLSANDRNAILQSSMEMSNELAKYQLKSREHCSLIENYVYTDAVKISKLPPDSLDEQMDYIREVSAVHGRFQSGPCNAQAVLSQQDMAVNEAAAWLVRLRPALLTHMRQLQELANRAVKASGLTFKQQPAVSPSTVPQEKWSSQLHRGLAGAGAGTSSMHIRLQGDLFNMGGTSYVEADDEMDDTPGTLAQFSEAQLEELTLGGGAVTFGDAGADVSGLESMCSLSMQTEEVDIQLNEEEILRISGCKELRDVKTLRVPCAGFTSMNVSDLSRCVRLVDLDVSENALRGFPRRLHLPRLRRLGLTGNRYVQLPLVEQFPQLTRLTIDEKYKQVLNPQMLAYFCPRLKMINGQYFDTILTEFTVRIIQEAKATVEPHIRSKWDSEFAEKYQSVHLREERITILEHLVKQLKEKNLLVDETIGKYKDLLLFRFAEDYLKSKLCDPEDELLAGLSHKKLSAPGTSTMDLSDAEEEEHDEEEKDAEAKAAGESALFKCAEELLTFNPEPTGGPPMAVVPSVGHQQVVTGPGGEQISQLAQPHQIHLGRSLRQGKSVVMTVVKPKGVSGRPVAEFLPGELRNKDYVKGYMASEIYKKAVKDTLGQKGTPQKRPGPGRPRKSDQPTIIPPLKKGPLNEVNSSGGMAQDFVGGGGMIGMGGASGLAPKKRGRPTKLAQQLAAQAAASGVPLEPGEVGVAGVPPRPKKRRTAGINRSLRDLSAGYTNQGGGPTMIDYDPLHFIRCHARDNDASDNETKVWRCLFEPSPYSSDETTHVVATCGGECVCLINCESGKVMKRFKHIEEEFYSIAWTTVEVEGGKRTNLLAAAGKLMEIRLLHPEQLVCYAEMKGHSEDISSMTFHQTQPTILFSGDSKASVLVWDIGVPSVPDYKTRYQLLMRLRCPRLDVNPVLNLVFLPHYAYLVAGCEDGIFAWKFTEFRAEKREREPDMELKIPSGTELCFDGLAQLSDNALVVKCVEEGELYVFDFASVLEKRKGLQRIVPFDIRGHLTWQKTDEIYINVSVRQNLGAVLCGDNEGGIWIYDIDPFLDDLQASSRKKFTAKPIKILEWPECSVQGNRDEDQQLKESITSGFRNPVVNTVEMSSDGHYLAAVTDNNLVCIWRVSQSHGGQQPATAVPIQQHSASGQQKQSMVVRPMTSSGGQVMTASLSSQM